MHNERRTGLSVGYPGSTASTAIRLLALEHDPLLIFCVDQNIWALEAFAFEGEDQFLLVAFFQVVCALIPDLDCAGAVLAFGDYALEVDVAYRVILDLNGQSTDAGGLRRAFRYRPTLQYTIHLQPEIPVEVGCMMLLDYESVQASLLDLRPRLGSPAKISLLGIFF